MNCFEVMHADLSAKAVRFATFSGALGAGGTQTLVAAVTGKKIRVLAMTIGTSAAANVFELKSGAGGTKVFEAQANITVGFTLPFSAVGWFETAAGALLQLVDVAGSTARVNLVYVEA